MFSSLFLLCAIGGYISLIVATIESTYRSNLTKWFVAAILTISMINTIIIFAEGVAAWVY